MRTFHLAALAFTLGTFAATGLASAQDGSTHALETDDPAAGANALGPGECTPPVDEKTPVDPNQPEELLAPPMDDDRTNVAEILGVTALSLWTATAWIGAPASLIALGPGDIGPGEAAVLTATNLLGIGTLGAGFGLIGAGGAMFIIGTLGYVFTLGYWDGAGAYAMGGVAIAGVGALLAFVVAPLVFTLNAWAVDSLFGQRPDNLFAASAALVTGSFAGAFGGFYIADLLVDFDDYPALAIAAIVGTSLLVGNVAYATTRRITEDERAPVMVILPPIVF